MNLYVENQNSTLIIGIKVKTNAKEQQIRGSIVIDGMEYIKIDVKSAPENGKANSEIIKFLASILKINMNKIQIFKGGSGSLKLIKLHDITFQSIELLKNLKQKSDYAK